MALITCPECGRSISDQAASCPQCGHPAPSRPMVPPAIAKELAVRQPFVVLALGVCVAIGLLVINARLDMPPKTQRSLPAARLHMAPAAKPQKPSAPTLAERVAAANSLAEVLPLVTPHMKNTLDEYSEGTQVLAFWAGALLQMEDLMKLPETKRGLVMKDSTTEFGKRMCIDGTISQIDAIHIEESTLYEGGLMRGYEVTRFIAVGNTGDLVQRSRARFCGIVNGVYAYSNVSGGQTQAPLLVGMFDLRRRGSE